MLAGSAIGNFVLEHRLGRGGMGEVWRAQQHEVGTRVAIKLLLPDICEDEVHVQRFFNEARAVARIQHPGIVRIFDVGTTHDGRAYLVMELLEGESLAQRLRRGRPTLPVLADVCRQIALVLEATHRAGVTHRDLKPDNIYLVRDRELPFGERAKVLDFGIAKLTGTLAAGSPRTMGTLGTPAYMAPEQWGDASKVDWRADLYSLGCLAFELACGRPPFASTSVAEACAQHLHDAPPRARSLVPALPTAFDELVARLLAKRPADRPPIRTVIDAFAALADGTRQRLARGTGDVGLADTQPALAPADPHAATVGTVEVAEETGADAISRRGGRDRRRRRNRRENRGRTPFLAVAFTIVAAGATVGAIAYPRSALSSAPTLELAAQDPPAPDPHDSLTRAVDAPPPAMREQRGNVVPQRRASEPAPTRDAPTGGATTAPQTSIQVIEPPRDPRADLPRAPTTEQIIAVLQPFEAGVKACGSPDGPASIAMELLIMPSGKVARATPLYPHAFTPLGTCASDAVIHARFPETQLGVTKRFEFALR